MEKTDDTGRLCRMNLAVHGLEGDIRHGGDVNSYYDDPHDAVGTFDFALANPPLSGLIDRVIGPRWRTQLERLEQLRARAGDHAFIADVQAAKIANKQRLAHFVERVAGVAISPHAMFDVQIKRIHEYKRQLLCVLHIIHLYNEVKAGKIDKKTAAEQLKAWREAHKPAKP